MPDGKTPEKGPTLDIVYHGRQADTRLEPIGSRNDVLALAHKLQPKAEGLKGTIQECADLAVKMHGGNIAEGQTEIAYDQGVIQALNINLTNPSETEVKMTAPLVMSLLDYGAYPQGLTDLEHSYVERLRRDGLPKETAIAKIKKLEEQVKTALKKKAGI